MIPPPKPRRLRLQGQAGPQVAGRVIGPGSKLSLAQALAKRHLTGGCTVLYDLSSSCFEGHCCPLAKYGHSRDHREDRPQDHPGPGGHHVRSN